MSTVKSAPEADFALGDGELALPEPFLTGIGPLRRSASDAGNVRAGAFSVFLPRFSSTLHNACGSCTGCAQWAVD
jgi:hypothetical protein